MGGVRFLAAAGKIDTHFSKERAIINGSHQSHLLRAPRVRRDALKGSTLASGFASECSLVQLGLK